MNEIRTGGGGASLTLLWENPNPTASFSSQTLQIDTSEYDWLMIYGISSNNNAGAYVCVENNPDFASWFVFSYYSNQLPTAWNGDIRQRYLKPSENKDTLYISGAWLYNTANDNSFTKPLKIYGVKGLETPKGESNG